MANEKIAAGLPGGDGGERDRAPRRRYERPQIIARERLEALASDCTTAGKNGPGDCGFGPYKS